MYSHRKSEVLTKDTSWICLVFSYQRAEVFCCMEARRQTAPWIAQIKSHLLSYTCVPGSPEYWVSVLPTWCPLLHLFWHLEERHPHQNHLGSDLVSELGPRNYILIRFRVILTYTYSKVWELVPSWNLPLMWIFKGDGIWLMIMRNFLFLYISKLHRSENIISWKAIMQKSIQVERNANKSIWN